jgi:hypothetical protein
MLEVLTACWIRFSLFAVCFSFNVLPCFLPLAFRGDLLARVTMAVTVHRHRLRHPGGAEDLVGQSVDVAEWVKSQQHGCVTFVHHVCVQRTG